MKHTLLFISLILLNLQPAPLGAFYAGPDKGTEVFEVVPNPGSGLFTVTFKSEQKSPQMLAVCDATGKFVYLKTIREFNGELKETVDLSNSPRGIYIFEIEWGNGRDLKKVIVQ